MGRRAAKQDKPVTLAEWRRDKRLGRKEVHARIVEALIRAHRMEMALALPESTVWAWLTGRRPSDARHRQAVLDATGGLVNEESWEEAARALQERRLRKVRAGKYDPRDVDSALMQAIKRLHDGQVYRTAGLLGISEGHLRDVATGRRAICSIEVRAWARTLCLTQAELSRLAAEARDAHLKRWAASRV